MSGVLPALVNLAVVLAIGVVLMLRRGRLPDLKCGACLAAVWMFLLAIVLERAIAELGQPPSDWVRLALLVLFGAALLGYTLRNAVLRRTRSWRRP